MHNNAVRLVCYDVCRTGNRRVFFIVLGVTVVVFIVASVHMISVAALSIIVVFGPALTGHLIGDSVEQVGQVVPQP